MHFHFLSRLNITAANRQSFVTNEVATKINSGRGSSCYPFIVFLLLGAFSGLSMAAGDEIVGDAAAGESKAALCAACHGGDGKGTQDTFPNLAGQGAGYIAKQLAEFKSGTRANAVMLGMAAALSEQDMADLGVMATRRQSGQHLQDNMPPILNLRLKSSALRHVPMTLTK